MSTETNQHEGQWWLPENPDNRIPGSLSVHQREGIKLKAVGALISMPALMNAENDSLSRLVVLGQTTKGKSISLLYVTPGKHEDDRGNSKNVLMFYSLVAS